jgi:hypothetical protein
MQPGAGRLAVVVETLSSALYYPIVAFLLAAVLLRRHATERKRVALISWGALFVAVRACAWLFSRYGVAEVFFVVPVAVAGVFVWSLRAVFFPLSLRCLRCRRRLPWARVLGSDDSLCAECSAAGAAHARDAGAS